MRLVQIYCCYSTTSNVFHITNKINMYIQVILVLSLTFCLARSADVTFKNVTFTGYSRSEEKFKTTILYSNSLSEFLPKTDFDRIEIVDQNIPILNDRSLSNLYNLEELVIENCGIQDIQSEFVGDVTKLKISLKGNLIQHIYANVFQNQNFTQIDLSFNNIATIYPNAFDDMPSLVLIDLSSNKIENWNVIWFQNTPSLTFVSLQNNSIQSIPRYAFKNLDGGKGSKTFKTTITVILNYNKIITIEPEAFSGLKQTYDIMLDNNQLENLDEDLLSDAVVFHLSLNNNNISCLDGNLNNIIKAKVTYLESNPFRFECLNKLRKWVNKNKKTVFLPEKCPKK